MFLGFISHEVRFLADPPALPVSIAASLQARLGVALQDAGLDDFSAALADG